MAADVRDHTRTGIWHRSSRCGPGKNCVELGRDEAGVIIRDSKGAAVLRAVNDAQWSAFLAYCQVMR